MATKNLIINNELGSFTFNEETLNALESFLVYSFPLVNHDLERLYIGDDDSLDQSYRKHIDEVVRPLVRNLYAIIHHSKNSMEIRVYKTQSDYSARKCAICHRVMDSDIKFPYESCIVTFRALYGVNCVVEFVVL